ncbi:hypothetical protein JNJ66_05380 [Candidatus Saccharibacteria bacterium]|nr:hypothetical protein [Candidatus Saccharibacteria bacterium]
MHRPDSHPTPPVTTEQAWAPTGDTGRLTITALDGRPAECLLRFTLPQNGRPFAAPGLPGPRLTMVRFDKGQQRVAFMSTGRTSPVAVDWLGYSADGRTLELRLQGNVLDHLLVVLDGDICDNLLSAEILQHPGDEQPRQLFVPIQPGYAAILSVLSPDEDGRTLSVCPVFDRAHDTLAAALLACGWDLYSPDPDGDEQEEEAEDWLPVRP